MPEMKDIAMMESPNRWPVWPRLPLKRKGEHNFTEVGILFEGSWTVYLCNMFQTVTKETPKIEYASAEAIAADGWVVD